MKDNTATSDYESAMIGKWHLGGGRTGPNDYGLDHFAGILGGGVSDYYNWMLNVNGRNSNSTNYVTSELTDQAIDWVSAQTQPWFLWLSYNAPHTPFHAPPEALHPRTLPGTQADINVNQRDYYLAAIEAMDTEFGRFWDSLSAAEQENTLVIYIGDNGTPRQVKDQSVAQNGNKRRRRNPQWRP
jgi:arylsulfatase A-like enzyme